MLHLLLFLFLFLVIILFSHLSAPWWVRLASGYVAVATHHSLLLMLLLL